MSNLKGYKTMEITTPTYTVRIHGQINQQKIKSAAERYARKWAFRRKDNEKKSTKAMG